MSTIALVCVTISGFITCSSRYSADVKVTTNEEILRLLKDPGGKITVANFWATWCAPCVLEMPELIRFYREYGPRGVRLVSISADDPDEPEKSLIPFMEKQRIPFRVYVPARDEPLEGLIRPIDPDWDADLPATFVFDGSGELQGSFLEEVTFSDLAGVVDPMLRGQSPSTAASAD